jgi:plasmid stabilization system protein ParE
MPRYERSGIRRRSYREYLNFYRVTVNRIDVLHVLNGTQDYESILFSALDVDD